MLELEGGGSGQNILHKITKETMIRWKLCKLTKFHTGGRLTTTKAVISTFEIPLEDVGEGSDFL